MKKQKHNPWIAVVLIGVLVAGVFWFYPHKKLSVENERPIQQPVVIPTPVVSVPTSSEPDAPYRLLATTTDSPSAELAAVVGPSAVDTVIAFNRLDAQHIPHGETFVIPKTLDDWNALSPFPNSLPAANGIPKLLLVSQRVQAFGVYESGNLVRWGAVSTGKSDTQTPSKLYFTNWKGKLVVSSVKDEWILPWYFNLDNLEGVSLHQYALPGYPASHSCVRMSEADAEWIYNWADQWILASDGETEVASGTPVIVFGEYAYGKTAPWKKLAADPTATTLTVDDLTQVITPDLATIQTKAQERSTVEATLH